jgi:hypothetical protein
MKYVKPELEAHVDEHEAFIILLHRCSVQALRADRIAERLSVYREVKINYAPPQLMSCRRHPI